VQNISGSYFDLEPAGIIIPLPYISYNNGFEISNNSDTFTVEESGFYLIQYKITTDSASSIATDIYKNGAAIPTLADETSGIKLHFGESMVFLNTGDRLQLVIAGHGRIQLIADTGASLNIVKIA
jgi:hypothetical protein